MIPDINLFTNLGVAGITLFIIYVMLQYFTRTLTKKDDYIKELIIQFQGHVEMCNTNFLLSSTRLSKSSERQTKTLDKLVKMLESRTPTFNQLAEAVKK